MNKNSCIKNIIVDGHSDSLSVAYDKNINLDSEELNFNFKDISIFPYIQFLATFINPKYVKDNVNNGFIRTSNILDYFDMQYKKLCLKYDLVKVCDKISLDNAIKNNKIGIVLTIENGSAYESDISNIYKLYNRGIRVMGLTWNDDNLIASGASTKNDLGLSKYGKICVECMNRLGIIVDVSHLSFNSFYDVMDLAKNVVATHSNVYSLCAHVRNLKDDMIKKIAKRDGVIGICFCKEFLSDDLKNANINMVINHIKYIADLVGVDYVGIGSDFDGVEKVNIPNGIASVKDIPELIYLLEKSGFSSSEIYKIMGGNYIRVLNKVLR